MTAVGVALVLAGCGSSGDQAAEATPRLTKPQLVKKLDQICQSHTDRQVVAVERFDKRHGYPVGQARRNASNQQFEEELVKVILPIVHSTIHDLEKLHPPRAQEADFKAFLAALEHGIAYSERDPSWVLDAKPEPFAKARLLSWKLGTALCGQA